MKIIYSNMAGERLPKYQIQTSIVQDGDQLKVIKKPLYPEGHSHVQSMSINFVSLTREFPQWRFARPEPTTNGVEFEYIKGKSLNELLIEIVLLNDKKSFYEVLNQYIRRFIEGNGQVHEEWESDSLFFDFFGCHVKLNGIETTTCTNLDLTFDNIIATSTGEQVIIDYEWVVNFAVPTHYLLYRSLRRFFVNNHSYMASFLSLEECLISVGIEASEADLYYQMELGLRRYVYGSDLSFLIPESHFKPVYHAANNGQIIVPGKGYFNQDYWEVMLAPVFDAANADKQIYIWGTGGAGIKTLEYLLAKNLSPSGFIDSNAAKWGDRVNGFPIWAPAYLNEVCGDAFVIIGSSYYSEIIPVLETSGYKKGKDFTIGLIL